MSIKVKYKPTGDIYEVTEIDRVMRVYWVKAGKAEIGLPMVNCEVVQGNQRAQLLLEL